VGWWQAWWLEDKAIIEVGAITIEGCLAILKKRVKEGDGIKVRT